MTLDLLLLSKSLDSLHTEPLYVFQGGGVCILISFGCLSFNGFVIYAFVYIINLQNLEIDINFKNCSNVILITKIREAFYA